METIANYELIRLLGQGGMGKVYQARDLDRNRIVALKVLRDELLDDPTSIKRFYREAQALARLEHKNIVKTYDIGESDGQHFLVMEYIDGDSLDKLIKDKGYFSADEVIDMALQVADALHEAHSCKVIHRDIKPPNILVDRLGRIKVTDFGLARITDTPGVTEDTLFFGTPEYMAPERTSELGIHPESDIYSFGIVLYEMLTGKVPFRGNDGLDTLRQHREGIMVPPADLNPEVPLPLSMLVMKALAKEASDRFSSVAELKEALQKVRHLTESETVALAVTGQKRLLPEDKPIPEKGSKSTIFYGVALFVLVFLLIKIFMIDPVKGMGESLNVVNSAKVTYTENTSTSGNLKLPFLSPETQKKWLGGSGVYLVFAGIAAVVAFWLWMLVDCLAGERYYHRYTFCKYRLVDRAVWLGIFIYLNIFGAMLYRIVLHVLQKRSQYGLISEEAKND